MSCPGLHCAGCAGGGAVAPVGTLAAAFGLAWVAEHLVEVIAVSATCGVLAVAAVVALMRWTDRREAGFAAALAERRERQALTATATPQVTRGTTPPAIEYHVHHHYYADSREPARVIPGKVLP
jgi:hypothetical protein